MKSEKEEETQEKTHLITTANHHPKTQPSAPSSSLQHPILTVATKPQNEPSTTIAPPQPPKSTQQTTSIAPQNPHNCRYTVNHHDIATITRTASDLHPLVRFLSLRFSALSLSRDLNQPRRWDEEGIRFTSFQFYHGSWISFTGSGLPHYGSGLF